MMKERKNNLLTEVRRSRDLVKEYNSSYIGIGNYFKLKRLLRYGVPYAQYLLARYTKSEKSTVANLFNDEVLMGPLIDSDIFRIRAFGMPAGDEYPLVAFFIKNMKEDDVFYDIGTNYGFYSLVAKEYITKGEIHVFEPEPKVFHYLDKNVGGENIYKNNVALSDKIGQVQMFSYLNDGTSGSSTIVDAVDKGSALSKLSDMFVVNTTTMDKYVEIHSSPTLIKLDVEGAEEMVINGGWNTILKHKPVIAMEVWADDKEGSSHQFVLDRLCNAGYKLYTIHHDGEISLITNFSEFSNSIDEFTNIVLKTT